MNGMLNKLKSVGLAFIPVILTIVVMMLLGSSFSASLLLKFAIGVLMVIVGETLFLQGIDSSIMNMGEIVGNASNKVTKFFVLVIFGFVFGLFATMAEPSVQILALEAVSSGLNVSQFLLVFALSFGTGVCVALALFKIVARWSFKVVVFVFYVIIFAVAIFVPEHFVAIAFDGGAATVSEVASPFLLALAAGIARHKVPADASSSRDENFGLIGIACMGPVLAVLILGLIFGMGNSSTAVVAEEQSIWISNFFNICWSIIPLLLIFFLFQAIFVKIPKSEKIRICLGTAVTFVGLYLFLVGIDLGFLGMGEEIGKYLLSFNNPILSMLICSVLGFALCYCEPAVFVLSQQVEELTNGNIKSSLVVFSVALSLALAVILFLCKIVFNWSFFVVLCIGYAIVFILLAFTSKTFAAIAFDSGGVSSGSMTSSFIMPIMIGFAGATSALDGFGVLAFVSMMPLIVVEAIGIVYQIQIKSKQIAEQKRKVALSIGEDKLSNLTAMEKRYKELYSEGHSV